MHTRYEEHSSNTKVEFSVLAAPWRTFSRDGNGPVVDDRVADRVIAHPRGDRRSCGLVKLSTTFQRLTPTLNNFHQDSMTYAVTVFASRIWYNSPAMIDI